MSQRTRHDVMKRLENVFGKDIEIVDATENLRLQPMPADCEGADPKSPDNCILVHTAQRMFGAKAAVFWKYWAYVDLIDPRRPGVRLVYRFRVSMGAFRHIKNLDTGKPFREGTAIMLIAASNTQTLDSKRKTMDRYRQTPAGQVAVKLNAARSVQKRATVDYDRAVAKFEQINERAKPGSPKLIEARDQRIAARKSLQAAREKVAEWTEKADAVRKTSGTSRPRKSRRFDLSTRNGAAGHYNFVHNGA